MPEHLLKQELIEKSERCEKLTAENNILASSARKVDTLNKQVKELLAVKKLEVQDKNEMLGQLREQNAV